MGIAAVLLDAFRYLVTGIGLAAGDHDFCAKFGEQLRGGGRQHLRLGARLRAHLVIDAPTDARGQGDLERDDGQQQDVGQRQEQPDTEAYDAASARASSSGALRRKPTPRIVCR